MLLVLFDKWFYVAEKCGILNVIFTLISLSGFILVAQPPFLFGESDDVNHSSSSRIIGALIGLSAAILSATVCVILRKLGSSVHFTLPMLYSGVEGTILKLVLLL